MWTDESSVADAFSSLIESNQYSPSSVERLDDQAGLRPPFGLGILDADLLVGDDGLERLGGLVEPDLATVTCLLPRLLSGLMVDWCKCRRQCRQRAPLASAKEHLQCCQEWLFSAKVAIYERWWRGKISEK